MKTSEDKMNEALRNVLKRKFDDYEEQPTPGSLDRIRARVKPPRTGRFWWFSGALLLMSVSGVLLSRYVGDNSKASGIVENSSAHASIPAKGIATSDSDMAVSLKSEGQSLKVQKGNNGFVNDLGDEPVTEVQPSHARNVGGATVSRGNGQRSANGTRDDAQRDEFVSRIGGNVEKSAGQDGYEVNRTEANGSGASNADMNELPVAMNAELLGQADSAVYEMPLEELASISLKEAQIPLRLRGVVVPSYKPAKVIVTNPAKIAWLFNASALHSYQILTVPSSAAKDFQNFNFPSLFTSRSMGYKFSAGVERKGIQVQLHYSDFRQTYSYEVANNNYLVKPDDKGQYHTVRQGDKMEENRKFSMLGIGITKQLRWGHSPVSRFYGAFGAEYSHDLNSSQSLGWITLGLGKQFAVSRNTAFSIGPYAEFSPVKVKSIANPFYYQPYRVGITAGLRFVRP